MSADQTRDVYVGDAAQIVNALANWSSTCHHSARTHDDQGCMVVCDCTATYEEAKETHK